MRRLHSLLPSAILVAFIAGCGKTSEDRPYIARVGTSVLTEEDLPLLADSLGSHLRVSDIAQQWVIQELLYQEAARRGVLHSSSVQHQLEQTRRQLAINALLEEELYQADTLATNEDAIHAFYEGAREAFRLKEDVFQVSYLMFDERDAANSFRSLVLGGTGWDDATYRFQQDPRQSRRLIQIARHQYFTQSTLYPAELWKLARTLTKDDVSFVVRTDVGYFVLTVERAMKLGEIPDVKYVRQEIVDRLMIEHRRLRYERLIAQLRAKQPVEIRVAAEIVDTTRP